MKTKKLKKASLLGDKFKKLFIAGILGWLVYLLGSVSDSVCSGIFLSEQALSAVEVVAPFYSLIAFISYIITPGSAVKYSHEMGQGNTKKAHQVFSLGVVISILLGIVTATLMFFFRDAFIGVFKLSDEVSSLAKEYYNWFIPIALITPVHQFVYRLVCEDGDFNFALVSDIGEMLANVIFSVTLVQFMGIAGLGLGTFISACISFLCISLHFFKKTNSIHFTFKFSFKPIKDMIRLGLGASLSCLFIAVVDLLMNFFIARKFGDSYLASYAMVNLIINYTELFTCVSSSMSGFISLADGSENADDIKIVVKKAKKTILIVCLITTGIMAGFCWLLPYAYGLTEGVQYKMATYACLICGLTVTGYGYNYLFGEYYTCLKNPKVSVLGQTLIDFACPISLAIGLGFLFSFISTKAGNAIDIANQTGYIGLLCGFGLTPVVSILIVILYIKKKNKSKSLLVLPEYGEDQFSIDLHLNEENIINTRNEIEKTMNAKGIEKTTIMNTLVVVEDLLFIIYYQNKDKVVTDRLTISIGENRVRLLNKDNGKVFQIAEKANDDSFLLFNMVPEKNSLQNSLMLSFNTASLIINRHR